MTKSTRCNTHGNVPIVRLVIMLLCRFGFRSGQWSRDAQKQLSVKVEVVINSGVISVNNRNVSVIEVTTPVEHITKTKPAFIYHKYDNSSSQTRSDLESNQPFVVED